MCSTSISGSMSRRASARSLLETSMAVLHTTVYGYDTHPTARKPAHMLANLLWELLSAKSQSVTTVFAKHVSAATGY
eukprot:3188003-Pleurochrysis_carterae.AAC.1